MRQRGFTLIEAIVIAGIGSIVTLGAMLTIQQILQNTNRNSSEVTALDDINRVALQIKRDVQSYQDANLTDVRVGPTTFTWVDRSGFEPEDERDHYSIYSLNGTVLYHETDNITQILGRYIDELSFTENGYEVDVEITAISPLPPYRSETLTFTVHRRADDVYAEY